MEIQTTLGKIRTDLDAKRQSEISPPNPTPPSSECEVCGDTGYIRLIEGVCRCECQKRKVITAKLKAIPERFRGVSFQGFIPKTVDQQVVRDRIWSEFTKSFYIFGDYGQGKTHLATAQYIRQVEIEKPCLFLSMSELLAELQRSAMDSEYFCTVRQRVRHADKFHLFIDDIDKFKVTEFKHEVLFDLVDTIYKRNLGLTVTSNYSLVELAASGSVHPSIVRRIDDICAAVEL